MARIRMEAAGITIERSVPTSRGYDETSRLCDAIIDCITGYDAINASHGKLRDMLCIRLGRVTIVNVKEERKVG